MGRTRKPKYKFTEGRRCKVCGSFLSLYNSEKEHCFIHSYRREDAKTEARKEYQYDIYRD